MARWNELHVAAIPKAGMLVEDFWHALKKAAVMPIWSGITRLDITI